MKIKGENVLLNCNFSVCYKLCLVNCLYIRIFIQLIFI